MKHLLVFVFFNVKADFVTKSLKIQLNPEFRITSSTGQKSYTFWKSTDYFLRRQSSLNKSIKKMISKCFLRDIT